MKAIERTTILCLNLMIFLFFSSVALATGEWSTNSGGDIYNNNPGGNVGIGTTSPSRKLYVKGAAGTAQIESTGATSVLYFGDTGSSVIDNQGIGSAGNDLFFMAGGYERVRILSEGNVGIGTTSPGSKLEIYNRVADQSKHSLFKINYGNWVGRQIDFGIDSNSVFIDVTRPGDGTMAGFSLNPSGGNIGIGTMSPGAKLDVNGNAIIGAAANTDTTIPLRLGGLAVSAGAMQYGNYGGILFDVNSAYTASARRYLITNALAINKFGIIRSVDAYKDPTIGKAGAITSGTADFVIDNNGNVGIGTTSPQSKLAVKGTITAEEIKVESGWSDFVFEDTYQLPPLNSVESYIKKHRHLPDIPSAKEVEQHGLAVSEMLAKQMQKIEELTLYLLKLEKENEALKVKNAEIEKRLAWLEKDG